MPAYNVELQREAKARWVARDPAHAARLHRAQEARRRAKNPEHVRALVREAGARWRAAHSTENRERSRLYQARARLEALEAYGGRFCACCGETTVEFLSLDHIDGRSGESVRLTGSKLYSKLRRQGWPPGYQVLCHNCNQAKGTYGTCPHKRGGIAGAAIQQT